MDLIAHALADEETSTIQVPHHQSVARQKSKLVADFGLMMSCLVLSINLIHCGNEFHTDS